MEIDKITQDVLKVIDNGTFKQMCIRDRTFDVLGRQTALCQG